MAPEARPGANAKEQRVPSSAVGRELERIRSRIANGYLIGLSAVAVPAMTASLSRAIDIGWQPIMGLHVVLAALTIGITLYRRRLPYWLRAGYLLGALYVLAVAGSLSFGLMSNGLLFFLSVSILAFLLAGTRVGRLVSILSGLSFLAILIAVQLGAVRYSFDYSIFATALSTWISGGIGLALMISAIGIGLTAFNHQLLGALRRAEDEQNELRAMSENYRTARDQALEAAQAKSQFLANASHELRTPLNAIIGFAEYLRLFGRDMTQERLVECAKDIHDSGQMLLAIVDDLLSLSRIDANRVELRETAFILAELVGETARMARPLADDAEVTIIDETKALPVMVRADRRIIYQILFNLLSNGIKFNRPGGEVRLTLRRSADQGLEIVITDTGIGVDPAIIPELFQPFRQANSEIARRYGGTGLGLSIVRRLAALHGGDVVMESVEGQGTTVRVKLPAARVMAETPAAASA